MNAKPTTSPAPKSTLRQLREEHPTHWTYVVGGGMATGHSADEDVARRSGDRKARRLAQGQRPLPSVVVYPPIA